ncbi:5-formyltetrahydrofolate cyclo-ligase [bacterium]|nr:5-formyltetrahydrofolate cyclo-ligase [bacterium]
MRLRAWVKQRRAGLSPDFRAYAASAVLGNVERWPRFQEAGCVMAFASLLGEVDTMPILARILALGKRLVLPRVSPSRAYLEIYEVRILEHDLARQGKLGILEPLPTRCRRAEHVTIDLVLMPGLVFDARGGRIGYGAGYFDRFLATLCPMPELLAVAFDFQVLSRIPQFPEDVPMHGFATEAGLFRVRRKEWTCPSVGDTHAAARELDALVPADAVDWAVRPLGAGQDRVDARFCSTCERQANWPAPVTRC